MVIDVVNLKESFGDFLMIDNLSFFLPPAAGILPYCVHMIGSSIVMTDRGSKDSDPALCDDH